MLSTDGFFAFKKEGHEVSALVRMAFYENLLIEQEIRILCRPTGLFFEQM